jgi:two-component system, NtrC family, nitrogen regulation sensor histidine kinase NtrY
VKPVFRNILSSKYSLLAVSALLFTLSLIFNKLYSDRASVLQELRAAERYVQSNQKDFIRLTNDSILVRKLAGNSYSHGEFSNFTSKDYGIFLYTINNAGNWSLANWNSQLIVPPVEAFSKPDGNYFMHLSNGYYFVQKKTIDPVKEPILAFGMILIQSDFYVETQYLTDRLAFGNGADRRVGLSPGPTEYPVKDVHGQHAFYLSKKGVGAVPYNNFFTIILRLGAVLFLFLFFDRFADYVARRKGAWVSIGVLAGSLVLFRFITYVYPSILNLRQFALFDPAIYGSNAIQRSLGDLFVNSALFCWVILFAWSKLRNTNDPVSGFPRPVKWAVGVISVCLLIGSTLLLASIIRSMVADSKISFDVTDFFSLNEYTVVGFIVLACLTLSYYYFTQLLFRFSFSLFAGQSYMVYFVIALAGLLYLTARSGTESILFYLPVLFWLIIYTLLVNWQGPLLNRLRVNIAGILFWIFIFSVSISAIMLTENRKAEWNRRKTNVERLVENTDPSLERMLNIALGYLNNDFLKNNFDRFRDPEENIVFRDSLIKVNYQRYINAYDTRLYVYDSSDVSVNNSDGTSYAALNTVLSVLSKPANQPGLYYYEKAFDKITYITKRVVTDDSGRKMGSVFIISDPRDYKSEALLPELFKQFKQADPENSPTYSYAIYNDTSLVSFSTKYPFHTTITRDEVPVVEFERRKNGNYDEVWYRATNRKTIVMARKKDTLIETITLFSYIFCSFLFLVLFVELLTAVLKIAAGDMRVKKLLQWNIRSQVHGTIILISVLSFLIIGIATISFFISRYNRNNNDKLSRTMKIMVNEMQKKLIDHSVFDDVLPIYDSVSYKSLQQLVDEVSDIHGVDVNVYNPRGGLQVSSQPHIYNKGVLSKKMNPVAYYHLNYLREVQHVQEERIAELSYFSIYAPVRDERGKIYAYLNIPYFASRPELNQEIANFLVTIINLNAFIFLTAGLIALFIANRITRSFSFISHKMQEVNLGKMNEEIVWNRDDEIGELVKEYNKMVAKLGESAKALAKSEREGAWREMARQVAHEIKNPLTPMKLSLQYLQKSINNNQSNIKELTTNVANTLVEQIDHLSKIAADFSQFANIGIINVEVFDLHDVINSLKELYRSDEHVQFDWNPVNENVRIKADKTQMNRLFTNLFANAVDACKGNETCRIQVNEELDRENNIIRVSITDNGEGIPPEMESRIFVPNFTTKSSGTGLGLAMCKGIVEQAKGKIWFETERGNGTTFHVELPVMELETVSY